MLALFGCVLPFALVQDMGWWAVPIVVLVCFTLYGIDGIARQLEDPFGLDRNDIKVDGLVEDVRVEVEGLVGEWRRVVGGNGGGAGGEMFFQDERGRGRGVLPARGPVNGAGVGSTNGNGKAVNGR